jgi:hypothetical protein
MYRQKNVGASLILIGNQLLHQGIHCLHLRCTFATPYAGCVLFARLFTGSAEGAAMVFTPVCSAQLPAFSSVPACIYWFGWCSGSSRHWLGCADGLTQYG